MRTARRTKVKSGIEPRQVNIRVGASLYRALEALAREERRSVAQVARHVLDEGLGRRLGGRSITDDTPGPDIARLAGASGAFSWLADEPDLYDDASGEPL